MRSLSNRFPKQWLRLVDNGVDGFDLGYESTLDRVGWYFSALIFGIMIYPIRKTAIPHVHSLLRQWSGNSAASTFSSSWKRYFPASISSYKSEDRIIILEFIFWFASERSGILQGRLIPIRISIIFIAISRSLAIGIRMLQAIMIATASIQNVSIPRKG